MYPTCPVREKYVKDVEKDNFASVCKTRPKTVSVVGKSSNQEQSNIEHYDLGVSMKQAITGTMIFNMGGVSQSQMHCSPPRLNKPML